MLNILVIDDDPHVREGLVAVLEMEGHQVTEVDNASEGRKALSDDGQNFDVVLLDLWLPEDHGLNVLRDIRDQGSDIPVVVMSGGGPGRTLEQAIAMADAWGASEVLIKPFRNEDVVSAISKAVPTGAE